MYLNKMCLITENAILDSVKFNRKATHRSIIYVLLKFALCSALYKRVLHAQSFCAKIQTIGSHFHN